MDKNREFAKSSAFHRINFLYQAAHVALRQTPSNATLVRFYVNSLQTIAKKNVLKIDPSIKRTLCKKCCLLLIPGITSTHRVRGNRQKSVIITCLGCKTLKRLPLGNKKTSPVTDCAADISSNVPLPAASSATKDDRASEEGKT